MAARHGAHGALRPTQVPSFHAVLHEVEGLPQQLDAEQQPLLHESVPAASRQCGAPLPGLRQQPPVAVLPPAALLPQQQQQQQQSCDTLWRSCTELVPPLAVMLLGV